MNVYNNLIKYRVIKNIALFFMFSVFLFGGCMSVVPSKEEDGGSNVELDTLANGAVNIKGVNWADKRDNFVNGWVIPSGLSSSDDYNKVKTVADRVLSGFKHYGVNTVRLPINPPSVLSSWWKNYKGAIDEATDLGMNVILACWEADSSRDGRVDNLNLFWRMWSGVIADYGKNPKVYFEVFNEPHGYSLSELRSLYSNFLNHFPNLSRRRILLGGTGYSEDVTKIGDDASFDGCLLAIHDYSFFVNNGIKTVAQWESRLRSKIGPFAHRTVMTEFGAPMTTSKNYLNAISNDGEKAYMHGVTNVMHFDGVASVYWPGLRTNDSYSLFNYNGSSITLNNPSGLSRIKYGWLMSDGGTDSIYKDAVYRIVNHKSKLLLDVNGAATNAGASVIQWYPNGNHNQQWRFVKIENDYYKIINSNSQLVLDVNQAATEDGAYIIQWTWNGDGNQQWKITNLGEDYHELVNKNSNKVLTLDGDSTTAANRIIQFSKTGKQDQQWIILQQ